MTGRWRLCWRICAFAGVWATACGTAVAAADPAGRGEWTLYGGQMIANDLPPLAWDAVRGRIRTKPAYLVGVGYSRPFAQAPGLVQDTSRWLGLQGVTTALDTVATLHGGGEHDPEIDLAYTVRTAYRDFGGVRLRSGAGLGPSLALGRPAAEDGPSVTSPRRPRLQTYIGLEVEARFAGAPDLGAVLRVHHRSSAYGLVAPRNVGSNFVVLGLRRAF